MKMKPLRFVGAFFLVLVVACAKHTTSHILLPLRSEPIDSRYLLMITSDFGSVKRCTTLTALQQTAQTMISARPDIMALDASANSLCNYPSEIGHFLTGSPFDTLFAKGIDPMQEMIALLQQAGITVLTNVRMNDHHGNPKLWTPWEREHTEWSLGRDTGSRDWKSIGRLRQMDFAVPEVRHYRLSILEELIDRYDVDGIQLDFGRTPPFLSEPTSENAHHLTDFVRNVRALLDRQDRRLLFSVIVPWDTDFLLREGLQVDRWIDEGLVDLVCPGEWYYADWNIPFQRWKEWTDGSRCRLIPHTPGNVSPYQVFEYGQPSLLGENRMLDGAKIRAIAQNFFSQGVDGMAFYNYYVFEFGADYPFLRTWLAPETRQKQPLHFLYTRRLLYQPNEFEAFDVGSAFERLPLRKPGDWIDMPFRCSASLDSAAAILRLAILGAFPDQGLRIWINETDLGAVTGNDPRLSIRIVKGNKVRIAEIALPEHSLQPGVNILRVQAIVTVSDRDDPLRVGEFEIHVRPKTMFPVSVSNATADRTLKE
ncbi:family 10 glycosylhydrolase [candidate division KSB1 bacterium]|nr:family 10 glycosylhydrolase [candidate division KSB1 bacterium]